jgi:sarcosine oxidase subunit alpha
MSVARGKICGVPLLLFRVSFSGELGFEINVPPITVWRYGKRFTPPGRPTA